MTAYVTTANLFFDRIYEFDTSKKPCHNVFQNSAAITITSTIVCSYNTGCRNRSAVNHRVTRVER